MCTLHQGFLLGIDVDTLREMGSSHSPVIGAGGKISTQPHTNYTCIL